MYGGGVHFHPATREVGLVDRIWMSILNRMLQQQGPWEPGGDRRGGVVEKVGCGTAD